MSKSLDHLTEEILSLLNKIFATPAPNKPPFFSTMKADTITEALQLLDEYSEELTPYMPKEKAVQVDDLNK